MKLSLTQTIASQIIIANVIILSTPLVVVAKDMDHHPETTLDADGGAMKEEGSFFFNAGGKEKESDGGAVLVSQMEQTSSSSSSSLLRGAATSTRRGLSSTTTNPTDPNRGYLISFPFDSNEGRAFMIVDDSVAVIRQATTLDQYHNDYAFWTHEMFANNNIFLLKNAGTGTCLEVSTDSFTDFYGNEYHETTLQPCDSTNANQKFKEVTYTSDMYYENVGTGKVLGIPEWYQTASSQTVSPEGQAYNANQGEFQSISTDETALGSMQANCGATNCPPLSGLVSEQRHDDSGGTEYLFLGFYGPTTNSYMYYDSKHVFDDTGDVYPAANSTLYGGSIIEGTFLWYKEWTNDNYVSLCTMDDGSDCSSVSRPIFLIRHAGTGLCLEVDSVNHRYRKVTFQPCEGVNEFNSFQRFFVTEDDSTTVDDGQLWEILNNVGSTKYLFTSSCNHVGDIADESRVKAGPWLSCGQQGRRGLETLFVKKIWDAYSG